MKEILKPVIISHKRAYRVYTNKAVSNTVLFVSEKEAGAYREHNPDTEVITHSNSVIGLSAKVRATYEKFKNVCILDDDINYVARNFIDKFSAEGEDRAVKPEVAYDIIQMNAYVAKQMGVYFFGFTGASSPKTFRSGNPFGMTGFVIGGSMCCLDGFKLELPDEVIAADDYFLSGINAYHHRKSFIDTRYSFISNEGIMKSPGGCQDHRNVETEKNDYYMLRHYFGDAISRKQSSGIKKIQCEWERILRVPY